MKLLIVEDEFLLADSMVNYLEREGYCCELATNLEDAKQKSWDHEYDCFIVDINLPDGSGLEIIAQIKEMKSNSGIIIVSARNALEDRIMGLDIGADDYLTKPFSLAELNARIKSVLRRRVFDAQNAIVFNEITLNPYEQSVKVHGKTLKLTKKEYDLILYFISNPNRVIPKGAITEHLWGDEMGMADSFDFLYSHLKNLRKKISELGGNDYIQTIYSVGYKFCDQ